MNTDCPGNKYECPCAYHVWWREGDEAANRQVLIAMRNRRASLPEQRTEQETPTSEESMTKQEYPTPDAIDTDAFWGAFRHLYPYSGIATMAFAVSSMADEIRCSRVKLRKIAEHEAELGVGNEASAYSEVKRIARGVEQPVAERTHQESEHG